MGTEVASRGGPILVFDTEKVPVSLLSIDFDYPLIGECVICVYHLKYLLFLFILKGILFPFTIYIISKI